MKKLNVTISIMIVMALMAGSVFAAENVEKADNDEKPRFHRMRGPSGMQQGRMMRRGTGEAMMGRGMGSGMMGRGKGGRGRNMGRMAAILRLADELKLSEAQRSELNEIAADHRKNIIRQKAEIDLARVDVQELMRQDEPDIAELRSELMDIATLEVDMKCQQIQVRINAKNVLTEEQQEALKKILRSEQAQGVRGRNRAGRQGARPQRGRPRQ